MPARFAIASVDAPWSPRSANSLERRVEDLVAPFLGALPLWLDDHGGVC